MNNNFNEQDSLSLINRMIDQAQNNLQKGSADTLIIAGYVVSLTAVAQFLFIHFPILPFAPFWVWLAMIPLAIILTIVGNRKDKKSLVRTHVDRIIKYIWYSFMISVFVFITSIFITAYTLNNWYITIIITPAILAMMGLAQYITSVACRFKPFFYGAITFWAGAIITAISFMSGKEEFQFIILAICTVIGFIIPGHILNRKTK